jgi:hypothetical protein
MEFIMPRHKVSRVCSIPGSFTFDDMIEFFTLTIDWGWDHLYYAYHNGKKIERGDYLAFDKKKAVRDMYRK